MKKLLLTLMACVMAISANAWSVYFTNPDKWTSVYVWAWVDGSDGKDMMGTGWPGKAMTNQNGTWYYEQEDTNGVPNLIIFNNGSGTQTGNLTFQNGATFDKNGVVGAKTYDHTVYFKNSNDWEEVWVFCWDGYPTGDFPGVQLQPVSSGQNAGLFEWTVTDTSETPLSNVQFLFNNGNKGLQTSDIKTYVEGAVYLPNGSIEGAPVDMSLYIRGAMNEWGTSDQMVQDATNENLYSYTFNNVAADQAEFKIGGSSWDTYDFGGSAMKVYSDRPGTQFLSNGGGNIVISNWVDGPMSITFDLSSLELTVSGKNQPEYSFTVPTELYVIGNIKDLGWGEGQGVKMNSTSAGVFTIENVVLTDEISYFAFASDLTSWNTINNTRVGPTVKDALFVIGNDNESQYGEDASWSIPAGTYNFTVDFNKGIVTGSGTPTNWQEYSFYVYNSMGWNDMAMYIYENQTSGEGDVMALADVKTVEYAGSWPGMAASSTETVNGNAYSVFTVYMPAQINATIIFNNNNPAANQQTSDYAFSSSSNNGEDTYLELVNNGSGNGSVSVIEDPEDFTPSGTPTMATYKIYAYDNTDWEQLYLYIYGESNAIYTSSWPGDLTTVTEKVNGYDFYVYSVEMPEGIQANVMFNNGLTGEDELKTNEPLFTFNGPIYVEVVNQKVVAVDPKNFKPTDTTQPTVVNYYVIGADVDGKEWALGTNQMTLDETNNVYVWKGTKLGNGFKINDGTWDQGAPNIGALENQILTLSTPFKYTNDSNSKDIMFDADIEYVSNPVVTLNLTANTVTVTGTPVYVEVPEEITFYVIGEDVDGENWALETNPMTYDEEEDIYTWTGETLASGFKINNGEWGVWNIGAPADAVLTLGQAFTYLRSGNSGNIEFGGNVESVTKPVVTLDLNAGTILVKGTPVYGEGDEPGTDEPGTDEPGTDEPGTDGPGSGVDSLENDADLVIYNIQGVRVDSNKLTRGLYIINGKKVMVK